MSDCSRPPARSASSTQLYIVVNQFSSHEQQDLPPDNGFFDTRDLWSIAVQHRNYWVIEQCLLVDGNPFRKVTGDQESIEHPGRQLLYFEVANLKQAQVDDVNHIISSTDPEVAYDTLECNRNWVRDIFQKLVVGRILDYKKAETIFSALEMSCADIQILVQTS
ncbi:hypothetical protein FCIRC_2685 [Fusarium circinatum]|uniref:Uncharacterized protein n=1 Tax=Fusarium circinatum TaxID=48490 RepID=A0A8H5UCS2_FUSCI|nr:hypothetical protein FCIRC_2685 [Fusarium circinatum]